MKSIREFSDNGIKVVFTDIDGTLTHNGRIPQASYKAMWNLYDAGIHVVPVTGRPAGWCEMIARTWPVLAVVGENGGFYFQLHEIKTDAGLPRTEMKRVFSQAIGNLPTQGGLSPALQSIQTEVLKLVSGAQVASDQFGRMLDLAIDFAEDVQPPLPESEIQKIVAIFRSHGAHAKVSNIHVNGWMGDYDKRSMVQTFLTTEFPKWNAADIQKNCAFVGDSPNDEPMFQFFKNSFGVQNVADFATTMKHLPTFVADFKEGAGFAQIAERILISAKK